MCAAGFPKVKAMHIDYVMWQFYDGTGYWGEYNFSISNVRRFVMDTMRVCLGMVRDTDGYEDYHEGMENALKWIIAHFNVQMEPPSLVSGDGDAPDLRARKRQCSARNLMGLLRLHDMKMIPGNYHQAYDDLRLFSRALIAWFKFQGRDWHKWPIKNDRVDQ